MILLVCIESLNCGASLRTDTIFRKLYIRENMSTEKKGGNCDYDPEDGQFLSVEEWLRGVEMFAQKSGLSEDQKYCFARGKLKGSAKAWINEVPNVSCWSDFEREFRKRFSKNVSEVRFARILSKRKIQKGESVDQFFTDIVLLGRKHRISEKAVVKHVISAIDGSLLTETINNLEQLLTCLKLKQVTYSRCGFDKLADKLEIAVIGDVLSKTQIPMKLISVKTNNTENISQRLSEIFIQFRSAVSMNSDDIGTSKTHELVINVNSLNANPSQKNNKTMDHLYLLNLLKQKIIRKSHSTFRNNFVYKENLLLDLRELNSKSQKEQVDLISVETLLHALPYYRFFTILSFNGGHLQIPIKEASRKYLAFSTSCGHYEYCRAPKEFANTGAVFNKILIAVAEKLDPGDAVVLFDELIIPSATVEDGYCKLEKVMAALVAFGLTIDLKECSFFAEELLLFHWRISKGRRIFVGLEEEEVLKNDRLLQRFSLQYYRFPNVKYDLEIQTTKFASCINLRQGFELDMVQSKCEISSILMQRVNENNTIPLGIYNRELSPKEQRNRTSQIGILAMVESVLHFKQFLVFKPFKVITSNRKLYLAMKHGNLTDDSLRKLLAIQNMSISIVLELVTGKPVDILSLFG